MLLNSSKVTIKELQITEDRSETPGDTRPSDRRMEDSMPGLSCGELWGLALTQKPSCCPTPSGIYQIGEAEEIESMPSSIVFF